MTFKTVNIVGVSVGVGVGVAILVMVGVVVFVIRRGRMAVGAFEDSLQKPLAE